MSFEYLDRECEKLLKELIEKNGILNINFGGTAITHLIEKGYVNAIETTTLSDKEKNFTLIGITQKGKTYFELKVKYERDQKQLSIREWKIAIVSAIIGAIIGLIPTIINILGGG